MIRAQELEEMRREVDDQQPSARTQQPRGFAYRACRVVEEMQDLMDDDQIERVVDERRAVRVTLAQVRPAYLGALEVRARHGQHRMAAVEADRMCGTMAEELQHAA